MYLRLELWSVYVVINITLGTIWHFPSFRIHDNILPHTQTKENTELYEGKLKLHQNDILIP